LRFGLDARVGLDSMRAPDLRADERSDVGDWDEALSALSDFLSAGVELFSLESDLVSTGGSADFFSASAAFL
jgi:hypothetical protein